MLGPASLLSGVVDGDVVHAGADASPVLFPDFDAVGERFPTAPEDLTASGRLDGMIAIFKKSQACSTQ